MKKNVFKLYANCQMVKGAVRGTLCDLQRGRIKLIPNDLIDLLSQHEGASLEEIKAGYDEIHHEVIEEYFRFLVDHDWGMWTTVPEAFTKLDLTFETPELVSNAIIDLNRFSDHDFQKLATELDDLGCRNLQLRIFYAMPVAELDRILQNMKFSVLRGIDVMIGFDADVSVACFKGLCREHQRIHQILRHGAPEEAIHYTSEKERHIGMILDHPMVIDSHLHCGVVAKLYFSPNQFHFSEALTHNTCLNKKISVDSTGRIRNCPSLPDDYGHHGTVSLREALFTEGFRDRWSITKDQISVCKDCEFRYVCTDCRAYIEEGEPLAKPSKCAYNPYTAQWATESTQEHVAALAV